MDIKASHAISLIPPPPKDTRIVVPTAQRGTSTPIDGSKRFLGRPSHPPGRRVSWPPIPNHKTLARPAPSNKDATAHWQMLSTHLSLEPFFRAAAMCQGFCFPRCPIAGRADARMRRLKPHPRFSLFFLFFFFPFLHWYIFPFRIRQIRSLGGLYCTYIHT
ncbi:hypothetical protein M431DRAFT_251981 [Trichoderma harzianum CBS 226.95]|uniref:Uncharacterized protein n=1 Tax=Trichoderma harzianum CBS 226.95 TaxID=983964 RepID=A0A2T3ZZZ7_TRIHA|nr:hypothetical protein M431DRAFT_251981 [Trichoderma harzianum CBS 226.95]PTB50387.1 hypothetical protein M431DRAFT_251981 [Trichoderma harzianum CBS 226.95]